MKKNNVFKRIIAAVLMLMLLTVGFAGQAATATGASLKKGDRIITTGREYIRYTPDPDDDAIGTVPSDVTLTLKADSKRDYRNVAWYKISYNGHTGWISSKYTKVVDKSAEKRMLITTGRCNVRAAGNLDARILDSAPEGYKMTYLNKSTVDENDRRWYKVDYDGIIGWVSSRYAKFC